MHWAPVFSVACFVTVISIGGSCVAQDVFDDGGRFPLGEKNATKLGVARLAITPDGSKVISANHEDSSFSVFDTRSKKVVAEVRLEGRPRSLVATNEKLYVALAPAAVAEFDLAKLNTPLRVFREFRRGATPDWNYVSDMVLGKDGKSLYLAVVRDGLLKINLADASQTLIDDDPCPMELGLSPDGKNLYVNYQCGPRGNDPFRIYDVANGGGDRKRSITKASVDGTTKPLANVGGRFSVSPTGGQIWATGNDVCRMDPGAPGRRSEPVYSTMSRLACPGSCLNMEKGCGIINIIDTKSFSARPLVIPARGLDENATDLLVDSLAYFPSNCGFSPLRVAVSTESSIIQFNTQTTGEIGNPIKIKQPSNVVFDPDCNWAYVAEKYGALHILRIRGVILTPTTIAWNWYWSLWRDSPIQTFVSHLSALPVAFLLLAFLSTTWARWLAHVPALKIPLEIDVRMRGANSQLLRPYFARLKAQFQAARDQMGARATVPLPVRQLQPKEPSTSKVLKTNEWIADFTKALASHEIYKVGVQGNGGTGKSFFVREVVLRLAENGYVPILLDAVDYSGEKTFKDWLSTSISGKANIPLAANVLPSHSRAVYVIDQASEVRPKHQTIFWEMIAGLFGMGAENVRVLIAGRDLTPSGLKWDDLIGIDRLSDEDIRALGSAYLSPDSQSEEVRKLPETIRRIVEEPTAFIVASYARARLSSPQPITDPQSLYNEILRLYIPQDQPVWIRTEIASKVLKKLVFGYFGTKKERGLPLETSVLAEAVQEIFKALSLVETYGSRDVPTPIVFVDKLLSSGLVYATNSRYRFFHDNFEDWLMAEAGAEVTPLA